MYAVKVLNICLPAVTFCNPLFPLHNSEKLAWHLWGVGRKFINYTHFEWNCKWPQDSSSVIKWTCDDVMKRKKLVIEWGPHARVFSEFMF